MQEHTNKESVALLVAETAPDAVEQSAEQTSGACSGENGCAQQDDPRVDDLDRRIRDLEAAIGDLRTVTAAAAAREERSAGRRTLGHAPQMTAKHGETAQPGAVDAALRGLSPEQRMFVKSGLLRAGLL